MKHRKNKSHTVIQYLITTCLLYTSDAADEEDSVDLDGRGIIKKKKNTSTCLLHTSDPADDTNRTDMRSDLMQRDVHYTK